MNRTEKILLFQKMLEISTRRRQASLTAAPHGISYVSPSTDVTRFSHTKLFILLQKKKTKHDMSGDLICLAGQWTGPPRPIHRCPGYSFDRLKTYFLRKTASSVDRKRNSRYTKYFKVIGVTCVKCNSNAQNTRCCSCKLMDFCCHFMFSVSDCDENMDLQYTEYKFTAHD
jgi:hypothetical protein